MILPQLRKDLQSIYLNRLLWIAQMKKDPIHKQIMKTKDAFANDDNFDPEEALEAAVDRRKFLMKRLFGDTRSTNDFEYLITRTTHSPKNRNLFEPYRAKLGLNEGLTLWVAREETALCLDVGVAILQNCQIISLKSTIWTLKKEKNS